MASSCRATIRRRKARNRRATVGEEIGLIENRTDAVDIFNEEKHRDITKLYI